MCVVVVASGNKYISLENQFNVTVSLTIAWPQHASLPRLTPHPALPPTPPPYRGHPLTRHYLKLLSNYSRPLNMNKLKTEFSIISVPDLILSNLISNIFCKHDTLSNTVLTIRTTMLHPPPPPSEASPAFILGLHNPRVTLLSTLSCIPTAAPTPARASAAAAVVSPGARQGCCQPGSAPPRLSPREPELSHAPAPHR